MALLTATDLNVIYRPSRGENIWAVRDVSFITLLCRPLFISQGLLSESDGEWLASQ